MRRPIRFFTTAIGCALLGVLALVLFNGCASLPPSHFATGTPRFDPIVYFTGLTHSRGTIENRAGNPTSTFRAQMRGVPDADGALTVTQDFRFDDGRKQQRVWHMRRVDAHRFDATASDVIGVAIGYAWGNTFRWEYTLQVKPSNALTRVRMHHWMTLTEDGKTMLNRVVITKLGIVVAETTEYFQRDADPDGLDPIPAPTSGK